MYKVLVPKALKPAARDFLKEKGYELVVLEGNDEETMKKQIADVDAVIARTEKYTPAVIEAAQKLRIIARYGIGYENINLEACDKKNITVTLARGCNTYSVAEHAISLMLACFRQIPQLNNEVRKGNWKSRDAVETHEARYKTFGSIGIGPIGMEAVKIAHFGFQMKILVYDKFVDRSKFPDWVEFVDTLDELMERADVISPHLPLNKGTFHIINEEAISHMKPTGVLLNVSRGAIWDEKAVYKALKEHRIGAAGADVFETEPPTADAPLFEFPNYVGTPHTAALTEEAVTAVAMNCAHAIDDYFSGKEPMYIINHPQKG
jgi:D-3-phosphoglycerate dehydrogenase